MNAPVPGDDERRSEPERRIDALGREAFGLAVSAATKAATQEVARIHRIRLVTQTAIATGVVALAIAFVVGVVLYDSQQAGDRRNAIYNCQLIRQVTEPLARFVRSDAELRASQARLTPPIRKGLARLFGEGNLAAAEAESARLNAAAIGYWKNAIVPQLQGVAGENCELHLK